MVFDVNSSGIRISNHCKCFLRKVKLVACASRTKINNCNIDGISSAWSWNACVGSPSATHTIPPPTCTFVRKQTTIRCNNHSTLALVAITWWCYKTQWKTQNNTKLTNIDIVRVCYQCTYEHRVEYRKLLGRLSHEQ